MLDSYSLHHRPFEADIFPVHAVRIRVGGNISLRQELFLPIVARYGLHQTVGDCSVFIMFMKVSIENVSTNLLTVSALVLNSRFDRL